MRDPREDAVERYERAVELAERIRAEWAKAGCPLTAMGGSTGKVVVTHPLVLLLLNVERDAQRFSHEVAVQRRVRPGTMDERVHEGVGVRDRQHAP
jgi:hypothetical protein